MNRREFTKGLVAASLTPALPIKAFAAATPAAAIAKDSMYFWANFVTRVHNKCSPDMLMRLLHIDPAHSAKLYAQLMSDGAITAPNIYGLSQSTNPLYQQFATVTGHGSKVATPLEEPKGNNLLKDTLVEEELEEEDVENELDTENPEPEAEQTQDNSDEDFTSS